MTTMPGPKPSPKTLDYSQLAMTFPSPRNLGLCFPHACCAFVCLCLFYIQPVNMGYGCERMRQPPVGQVDERGREHRQATASTCMYLALHPSRTIHIQLVPEIYIVDYYLVRVHILLPASPRTGILQLTWYNAAVGSLLRPLQRPRVLQDLRLLKQCELPQGLPQ